MFLPWTLGLPETYEKRYGGDLLDIIPELVWKLPEWRLSLSRYRFHLLITGRFQNTFCRQIGQWCDEHGLYLTGHLYRFKPMGILKSPEIYGEKGGRRAVHMTDQS